MSSISLELKRRLDLETEPLPKRLKLAENALLHPSVKIPNRDAVVLEWISKKLDKKANEESLKMLLTSLAHCAKLSSPEEVFHLSETLLNVSKRTLSPNSNIELILGECCGIYVEKCFDDNLMRKSAFNLLHFTNEIIKRTSPMDTKRILTIFSNCIKIYKNKTNIAEAFVKTEFLWTLMKLSEVDQFNSIALNLCRVIIFPPSAQSLYKKYFAALIEGNTASKLIENVGESLKPIVIVVKSLFECTDYDRLSNFLKLFTGSYKSDEALILSFNLILYKYLGVKENYIQVSDDVPSLNLKANFIKKLHLVNLQCFSKCDINLNTKRTFSDDSKTSKDLMGLLRQVTIKLIKEDIDDTTFLIVKEAFLLEPEILDASFDSFMPEIIARKKIDSIDDYANSMRTVLDVMFKMSKTSDFLLRLLPNLREQLCECTKLKKNITANDIFPAQFCKHFGMLSSELVLWQHTNLLKSIIENLEQILMNLSKTKFKSTGDLLLFEALSLILISVHQHSRMAEQNIPETVFLQFHEVFNNLESDLLHKLGLIVLDYPEEYQFFHTFLRVCESYGEHKLLLSHYQPFYREKETSKIAPSENTTLISNVIFLHSYLDESTWKNLYKLSTKSINSEANDTMNMLVLQNSIAIQKNCIDIGSDDISCVVAKLRKNIFNWPNLCRLSRHEIYINALFNGLSNSESKLLSSKIFVEIMDMNDEEFLECLKMFKVNSISKQHMLLSSFIMECIRNIWLNFEEQKKMKSYPSLYESSNNEEFNLKLFLENISDLDDYTNKLITFNSFNTSNTIAHIDRIMSLLGEVSIYMLNENVQYSVIFTLVILKIYSVTSSSFQSIQTLIESVFMKIYNMSIKTPNLFDIVTPTVFIKLIETNFFQLASMKWIDSFDIIKYIIQAAISKTTTKDLKKLIECIALKLKSENHEEKELLTMFHDELLQFASVLLVALHGIKKSSFTTDTKMCINSSQEVLVEIYISYMNKIKWKSIKSEDFMKNNVVIYNIESFSIIYKFQSNGKENKQMKKFLKAADFFTNLAIGVVSKEDINIIPARGAVTFINILLKNYKVTKESIIKDDVQFFKDVWISSKLFLKHKHTNSLSEWIEITEIVLENVTLVCELCDIKVFNGFLLKELINIENISNTNFDDRMERNGHFMHKLWRCVLHANLKHAGKNETRTTFVKQMCEKFFLWLKTISQDEPFALQKAGLMTEKNGEIEEFFNNNKSLEKKNLSTIVICIEIITEFLCTKNMVLSHSLIDFIIQMPLMIDLELLEKTSWRKESVGIFCVTFEKIISLLNALVIFRYELLQDRWPCFFNAFRKLMKSLCIKSDTRHNLSTDEMEKLTKLGIGLERITQILAKNAKQDISRMVAYLICDIISYLQKIPVAVSIKFHIHNCINNILQLLDNHAVGFLMRNMPDSSRIVFQQIYDTYNKYHKYVGAS